VILRYRSTSSVGRGAIAPHRDHEKILKRVGNERGQVVHMLTRDVECHRILPTLGSMFTVMLRVDWSTTARLFTGTSGDPTTTRL
jgi:hypothetical protein